MISLLPMCYLLALLEICRFCKSFVFWWAQQDLNLRPADYESVNSVLSALSSNHEKQHFIQA